MPTYCYQCEGCGDRCELVRPMAESSAPLRCGRCESPLRRDYAAELPRGQSFTAFESCAMGVPDCVMQRPDVEHVRRRGGWDTFVRDEDGQRVQINRPGTSLNKQTGDVLIGNRRERRRAIAAHGMVDYA
jgi:putative FmdB family regulatory protein